MVVVVGLVWLFCLCCVVDVVVGRGEFMVF